MSLERHITTPTSSLEKEYLNAQVQLQKLGHQSINLFLLGYSIGLSPIPTDLADFLANLTKSSIHHEPWTLHFGQKTRRVIGSQFSHQHYKSGRLHDIASVPNPSVDPLLVYALTSQMKDYLPTQTPLPATSTVEAAFIDIHNAWQDAFHEPPSIQVSRGLYRQSYGFTCLRISTDRILHNQRIDETTLLEESDPQRRLYKPSGIIIPGPSVNWQELTQS